MDWNQLEVMLEVLGKSKLCYFKTSTAVTTLHPGLNRCNYCRTLGIGGRSYTHKSFAVRHGGRRLISVGVRVGTAYHHDVMHASNLVRVDR